MNTPTFKEQFDKITRAYFRDELNPYDECACFVGNILNGFREWRYFRTGQAWKGNGILKYADGYGYEDGISCLQEQSNNLYSPTEIIILENNFMKVLFDAVGGSEVDPELWTTDLVRLHPQYETFLFEAMDSTLDMLRRIHEEKGEIIEDFEFTKRQVPA